MSLYGQCNFELVMGNNTQDTKIEQDEMTIKRNKSVNYNQIVTPSLITFKELFKNMLPKINDKEDIHRYILEIIKKEDKMDLNEKYISSICLVMNKHLLTKEIIEDILEEEFHLTLMNWLRKEKKVIQKLNENNENIYYQFNIFIGLLINIVTLFEIFPIKSSELSQFNFYKKLFKINKFINLKLLNHSFPFLQSLHNLLIKWKNQIDYFNLSKAIRNFTLLGKKFKRQAFTTTDENEKNKKDEKDKSETDADSEEKEVSNIKKRINKYHKNVIFDLEKNKIFTYDKEKSPSQHLNEKKEYDPLNVSYF